MKLKEFLKEELNGISTENKLYHRTNLNAIFGILGQKRLTGFHYPTSIETKVRKKTYSKYPEIATARKDVFSTIDKSDPKNQERLSLGIGAIEFELFKDRIRTLRSVNVEPIDELGAREREERVVLKKNNYIPVDPKYMKINIITKELEKDFELNLNLLGRNRAKKYAIALKDIVKENENMFNKNVGYNYFISWLDNKIKELDKKAIRKQ